MPTLTIDSRTVDAPEGATLLDAARHAKIAIPTLCHHPALEPYGGCRLCLVEMTRPAWNGAWKLVVSCMAMAEHGIMVQTSSDAVRAARREVLDLLLARCPQAPLVQALAREYGLERTSYETADKPTDCILCGMCSRTCEKIGLAAISMIDRGNARVVAPPLRQPPPDCVGCLACAEVCPTHCIPSTSEDQFRIIWEKRFDLLRCTECGRPTITPQQATVLGRRGVSPEDYELCDRCKKRRASDWMANVAGLRRVAVDL